MIRERLFLTGMMGAGKSRVGRRLALALGWRFLDLDEAVVAEAGETIEAIFAAEGEEGFRRRERTALRAELDDGPTGPAVIALGGGTYVQDGIRDLIGPYGPTVYLEVPAAELARRLDARERSGRPLLRSDAEDDAGTARRIADLLDRRRADYELADCVVDARGGPNETARSVLDGVGRLGLAPHIASVQVLVEPAPYPIWIGGGGVEQAAGLVRLQLEAATLVPSRVAVVTEDNVAPLYLRTFSDALGLGAWEVHEIVVAAGEVSKSVGGLSSVWTQLLGAGLGRGDVVVALGGGVVGDLAGFAAATLMRGVRLIQVPTTVLSQVDSSVGGKTGINHGGGKNLVGAFHQPMGVVMAQQMLRTLSRREVRSGLAEVVKYGVLEGGALLESLERDAESLVDGPQDHGELIATCCAVKAQVVAADEKEKGARALLNLGHTFGHAIEALEGYGGVTHGEAVSIGMVLAARASRLLGLAEEDLEPRLSALLTRIGLPIEAEPWLERSDEMAAVMGRDKKVRGDTVTLVLPVRPGDCRLHPFDTGRISWLLDRLRKGSEATTL